MSTKKHNELSLIQTFTDNPKSPFDWQELVHDALHSQPAFERWHDYVVGQDSWPSLVIYDQISGSNTRGTILVFAAKLVSAMDWTIRKKPVLVGRCSYTPGSPSTFLERVFRRFVAKVQQVDFAELQTHLKEVDQRYASSVTKV